jgi:hypothetical protein
LRVGENAENASREVALALMVAGSPEIISQNAPHLKRRETQRQIVRTQNSLDRGLGGFLSNASFLVQVACVQVEREEALRCGIMSCAGSVGKFCWFATVFLGYRHSESAFSRGEPMAAWFAAIGAGEDGLVWSNGFFVDDQESRRMFLGRTAWHRRFYHCPL